MRKKYPTPKLIPLDMSKAKGHEHPDLNEDDIYLCLFDNEYIVGRFVREWFGWSFGGWEAPLQFDEPGTNDSDWKQIWRIKTKS